LNNDPIEEKLHVVIVVSNPQLYKSRYRLAQEFIKRIETEEENVLLYIVEVIYNDQKYVLTDAKNKRHLQLHTTASPIWLKENMINLGVKRLLPSDWKAFAWIDADVQFDDPNWAINTLKVLNGSMDVIQLFSHAVDMDKKGETMFVFSSFGFKHIKGDPYSKIGHNLWHPGYAWACTRKAYEKMGGVYEVGILGSGDMTMALAFIGNALTSLHGSCTEGYKNDVKQYELKCKNLRLGYIPGVIMHHFHGSKKNRMYVERWQILVKHKYDPKTMVEYDKNGLMIGKVGVAPKEMLEDIRKYFEERNEDE
jgi:hypothetical protein